MNRLLATNSSLRAINLHWIRLSTMSKTSNDTEDNTSYTVPYSDIITREVLAQGYKVRVKGRGHSMYPFVRADDELLIDPTEPARLKIGDIIFFRRSRDLYVAHRLIKRLDSNNLITKGDNLDYYDAPVPVDQVLGRIISIERNGRIQNMDSLFYKVLNTCWARLSPISKQLRPVLRLAWKLYNRAF